ncbi:MAG: histidine kinase [Salibacteraceae bacterium]
MFRGFVQGQSPSYRQFSLADGLPSNEVYQVRVQSNGLIWFATDRGSARFDGNQFVSFTESDGLEDIVTLVMTEDPEGNMWFGALSGQLFKMQDDSLVPHPQNDLLDSLIINQNIQSFAVRNDTTWVGCDQSFSFRLTSNGEIKQLLKVQKNHACGLFFQKIDDRQVVFAKKAIKVPISKNKLRTANQLFLPGVMTGGEIVTCPFPDTTRAGYSNIDFLQVKKGELLFVESGLLYYWKKDIGSKFLYKGRFGTASMILNTRSQVLIGDLNGGVLVMDPNLDYRLVHRFLPSMKVSSICQDKEGGYWFATLNNGVIYAPNLDFRQYTLPQKTDKLNINSLHVAKDQLYMGAQNVGVLSLESSVQTLLDYSLHLELPVNDLQFLDMSSDNTFWAMERKTKYVRQPGSQWIQYPNYGRHVIDFNGETVKYIQRNAYREFKLKSVEVSREEVIQEIRTLDVHTDLYGEVWIAGIHGAFAFDTNEIFAEKLPFFEEETRVNCLYSDSLYLYGATFGKGVFQYHLQDATVRWITTEDGLASNTCSALTIDPYGKLWVGTNQGVSVMQPDSVGWSLVKNLHQFDGLEAQKINCLKAYQGLMWFGTDIGLWSTPLNDLSVNDFAPQVLITGKEILSREGGKSWQARELTYRENNLRFSFAAPLYRNGGEIKYRCVLYPNDSIYRYSNSSYPSVQYNSLAPGEYALAVQAQNSDGRWGPETAYSFVINPPYWGTWWFRALVVLVASSLIGGFIYYRYRVKMRESQWQMKVYESEHKALFAQINPHFIYNALHSAQYYLTSNQGTKAGDHLARFARLMRGILENSKASFFSIEKELELVELYISLEKERFDDAFEYRIEIDPKVDQLMEIPSMIIQPLVENALWHGILNRQDENGLLVLTVQAQKHGVLISIRDNGIGRKAVHELQAQQNRVHESSGLDLINNRLKILSSYKSREFHLSFVDHEDESGKPMGTEAQIFLEYEE